MLDEVVDYVKFLRMQVKVLSMSGLRGASARAQLVAKIPLQPAEGEAGEAKNKRQLQDELLNDGTGRQVVKLIDGGAAMQFLQSKAQSVVSLPLAAIIYHSHHLQPKPPVAKTPDAEAPS